MASRTSDRVVGSVQYFTVDKDAAAEWTIERSRFIASVRPVETEDEAREFIRMIQKKHWDATHNVSAYIVGVEHRVQHADDDGEPSGTAGRPVLEALRQGDLTNVVVVVTRYFGGIKLGAGGLVRAYRKSALLGVRAAHIVRRRRGVRMRLRLDYAAYGTVAAILASDGYAEREAAYDDRVTLWYDVPEDRLAAFQALVSTLTQGRVKAEAAGAVWIDEPVRDSPAEDDAGLSNRR